MIDEWDRMIDEWVKLSRGSVV